MQTYRKILAALDLSEESRQVLDKAQAMTELTQAELHLMHILEPLGYAYGGDIPMDLTEVQEQLEQQAREKISEMGEQLQVPKERLHVVIGRPESELHRFAEEQDVDLIIVGSHGRHGLQLLLGSTANGVLHGANCDVLAVRIK